MVEEKYYITTAIAYVNGKPHLGHTLEFIQADCIARFQRLLGKKVHFLTGTDEHGQKIVEAARHQNVPVKELVDKNAQHFIDFTKLLNMSNDDFIRTSDQKRHWPAVIKLWRRMHQKGDIYQKEYEGWYCVGCEKFIVESELEQGHCPIHKTKPRLIKEMNYFFRLSKYSDQIRELIADDTIKVIPKTRKNEIISFLEGDVEDISFSRHKESLSWGIPVPDDPDQVMYVWCDALANYISAIHYDTEDGLFRSTWPCDVHVIGKDILRFHAAYWPAMLISADVALPKRIFTHGFVNSRGHKMSKSLGNVVDPYEQIEKYGLDQVRLYLLKELPSYDDGDYAEEQLIETINNDLANDLGNLVQRVVILIEKNFDGKIQKPSANLPIDLTLIQASDFKGEYIKLMEEFELNKAAELIWEFIRAVNKYLSDTEPWKVTDKERLGTILYNAIESLRLISHYLLPFIPHTAQEILKRIQQTKELLSTISFTQNTQGSVLKGDILFRKLELKAAEKFPLDLRVAQVIEVSEHPKADKLYVLQIDVGTERRQLVAGLRPYYSKEEFLEKKIVIVSNLKHAKLRGVESQGMLLAGEDSTTVGIVTTDAQPGTAVGIQGMENSQSTITYEEFSKIVLEAKEGRPYANGRELTCKGAPLRLERVKEGKIK